MVGWQWLDPSAPAWQWLDPSALLLGSLPPRLGNGWIGRPCAMVGWIGRPPLHWPPGLGNGWIGNGWIGGRPPQLLSSSSCKHACCPVWLSKHACDQTCHARRPNTPCAECFMQQDWLTKHALRGTFLAHARHLFDSKKCRCAPTKHALRGDFLAKTSHTLET